MKNFLKLTAIFACLALVFVACNEDDTVDGYVPNFPAIDAESVTVTRGDGKIKVVWIVPDEESITYSKISWYGADKGSETLSVNYGEETTFIIGVDDEAGENGNPLPAGSYTIKIESMEGKYVGTGSWSSTESYEVYNLETYEGKYPVTTSIIHDNTNATITWGSFPDDCISVDINYTKEEEGVVALTVTPTEALEALTTTLEGAVIDSKVTFTPSFRPDGAIDEDIVTLVEGGETEITISDEVKSIPKIQSALGGKERLYVEWSVYQDLNISSSTVQVYDETGEVFGAPYTITYNSFDETSTVYGYTEETKDNTAVKSVYLYVDNTVISPQTFEAGKNYTVQVVNTVADSSVPATTEALYVYDDSIYGECPKVGDVSHNGTDAVVVWDLSAMSGYGADDVNSSYNALYKIEVTYNTDKVVTFTSEDTNHFSFECNLPDAAYASDDASFIFKAYYRPEGAIEADEEFVSVDYSGVETIPYPELASPVGVELRTGYNADETSYVEVKWFDVDGALGSVNDAIVDVLVFYTDDFTKLDALATSIDSNNLTGQSGVDYSNAAWSAAIGWEGATPVSVVNFLGTTSEAFVEAGTIINGETITIGKTDDRSGVDGLAVDTQYFVAVASINAAGQLNFNNLNTNYFTSLTEVASEWDLDLNTIDYDNYIQRTITTYNKATYTSDVANESIFVGVDADGKDLTTKTVITRSRTSAIIAWDWVTATANDVVAVKVTEYTNNTDGVTSYNVETATGNSTTLTYVKAGTGNISGHIVYFCPMALSGDVCGIERVEIAQTLDLDMPYLDIPGHEMTMMVGVNDGTTANGTVDSGEPYIKVSWVLVADDANVENISSYKVMYRTGTDEYVAVESDIASSLREATIAPSTPLTANVDYDVYISYVDLDGYTRPLIANTDLADGSEDAAQIKTYNKLTYEDVVLPLDGTIEEIAYDGETMTLYWGDVPTDCIGVLVTMTSGRREGQSYGYQYVLGSSTTVDDVDQDDTFTYTPYFRPSDIGEVIVAGKTSTQGCYQGESGTDPVTDLKVPVSTAPTRATITSITSSYVDSNGTDVPRIVIEWDFPDTELNRENILTETGSKYMYIYCYEDDATSYSYVNRMLVTDATQYSYEILPSTISVDKKYTIFVATKNYNNVLYSSSVYDGVKTYTLDSYDISMVPSITSALVNTNNEVEVTWSTEDLSEDLQNIFIVYNGEESEAFKPSDGVGTVLYKSGESKVAIKAEFKPNYEAEEADDDDPDYVAPEQVVFYGDAASFTSSQTEVQTLTYDIAYDGATYTIFTAKGLAAFADLVNGTSVYTGLVQTQGTISSWDQADGLIADVKLVDNIDLSDLDSGSDRTSWTPISDYYTSTTNNFTGTFDGNGYTISKLYINTGEESTQYRGLFGRVGSGGIVQNVTLTDVSMTIAGASIPYSGALVGQLYGGTVSGCEVASGELVYSPSSGVMSGGLVGVVNVGFTIENSINRANITAGNQQVGGIAAYMNATYGTITNCQNYGNLSGTTYIGGIIGYFYNSSTTIESTMSGCTNYGAISGTGYAAGVAGSSRAGGATTVVNFEDCVNEGTVTITGAYVGGISGLTLVSTDGGYINFTNCTNNAEVSGTSQVGGIAGGNSKADGGAVVITGCDNNGDVTATGSNVGGIIGLTNGAGVVSQALITGESATSRGKNTANVSGVSNVGAIVGTLSVGSTAQYYDHYYGTISGTGSNIGGIIGYTLGTVTDCIDKTDPANAEADESDLREVSSGNWEIYTFKGLAAFADIVNGTTTFLLTTQNRAANAVVKANLDFTEMSDTYAWSPMELYEGTFDGGSDAGYSIKNIVIETSKDSIGIFAATVGATIKNVALDNITITSTAGYVGAVVGRTSQGTTVQNCSVEGEISVEGNYVGGIVGYNYGGDGGDYGSVITGCTNNAKITGVAYVGGITGMNYPGTSTTACKVESCENTGKILSTANFIGGIVGYNMAHESSTYGSDGAVVYDCKGNGVFDTSGSSYVGGLVGRNDYSGAKVYGTGENSLPATYTSYNYATVYGTSRVGGIVGGSYYGATISYVQNSGEVKGTGSYIAGIVGEHDDQSYVDRCINNSSGNVYGIGTSDYVGQISGVVEDGDKIGIGNYTSNENYASVTRDAVADPDLELVGDIYKIWTAKGLIAFADLVNGNLNTSDAIVSGDVPEFAASAYTTINGEVIADLDFDDLTYTPISGYEGTFDGGGYTISNITISATSTYQGLFASLITGATVKNVKLKDFSLTTTAATAGSISGSATAATISNCEVLSGELSGTSNLGGIVGLVYASDIDGCINYAELSGSSNTGGIVGNLSSYSSATVKTTISNCVNHGNVTTSGNYPAGIVGYFYPNTNNYYACEISDCTNNGDIQSTGGSGCAGIIGYGSGRANATDGGPIAIITRSTNNGDITGGGTNVGGCVGYATCAAVTGGMEFSYLTNTGNVTNNAASNGTGGIGGCIQNGFIMSYCHNYGDVTSPGSNVGGILGTKDTAISTMSYCNNEGNITGASNVGGIAGTGAASLTGDSTTPNYNKGSVSGTSNVGGLVGNNSVALSYYNNYGRVLVSGVASNESYGLVGTGTGTITECYDLYEPTDDDVASDTFEISNETELLAFAAAAAETPSTSATLIASFSLSAEWTPIANYTGTFDGAGYTISGLSINASANDMGLFSTTLGATIKDLNLTNVDIMSSAGYAGAVVGYAKEATTISNCTVEGTVLGTTYIGGIAGYNSDSTIEYSSSAAEVSGTNYVGGISGYNHGTSEDGSLIDNCSNSGIVSGASCTGGITGRNYLVATVSNSINSGSITGTDTRTGGIVGHNCPNATYAGTTVSSCTNDGAIIGTSDVGGIVGENQYNDNIAYVYESSNNGSVTGSGANVGGIVGENTSSSVIAGTTTNYGVNYGTVAGTSEETTVGGIVGAANNGSISYYTNYGLVTINGATSNTTNGIYGSTGSATILSCYDAYVDLETTTLDIKLFGSNYSIYTAEGLVAFANIVNGTLTSVDGLESDGTVAASTSNTGANAVLQKDIDLAGITWTPIADYATSTTVQYTGTFDGNGKSISNLTIESTSNYQGLFGYVSGATISDVTMIAPVISANAYAGAIAGAAVSSSAITNCSVVLDGGAGSILTSANYAGSIVGNNNGSTVAYCSNEVSVKGSTGYAGGIAGQSTGAAALVVACTNGGTVESAGAYMGGIVGYNATSSQTVGCRNTAALTQTSLNCNGGIVGRNGGIIVGCYNSGSLTSAGNYNGGIVGREDTSVVAVLGNYYVTVADDSVSYGVGSLGTTTQTEEQADGIVNVLESNDDLNTTTVVNAMNEAIVSYTTTYKYVVGDTIPVLTK